MALSRERLGRIVVARMLELPLAAYRHQANEAHGALAESPLRHWTRTERLPGASWDDGPDLAPEELGRVRRWQGAPLFRYAGEELARIYRFDPPDGADAAWSREERRLAGRLGLITTRNTLTHHLLALVLTEQERYLVNGDPVAAVPLSLRRAAETLRTRGLAVDAGRLSRLCRSAAVRIPDGTTLALADLCPGSRTVYRRRLARILESECAALVEGRLEAPYPDRELAHLLWHDYGTRVTGRAVGQMRQELGIAPARRRAAHLEYTSATRGFSPLAPLTRDGVRLDAPPCPGVYELRSTSPSSYATRIIYIGSAKNLRTRLADHVRGNSGNGLLRQLTRSGVARFRYCRVGNGWREVERAVYWAFCSTFGAPPACNRVPP